MEKLHVSIACAILLIAAGCTHETLFEQQGKDKGKDTNTMQIAFNMPDESPKTRMNMERDGLDIKLKWEEGDALELCVIHGQEVEKQVVVLTGADISEDGKRANFTFLLPEGDYTTFDLYGAYGGGGLDDDDPTKARLPAIPSVSGNLEDLRKNKAVMLTFAKTDIDITGADLSIDLQHVGSLFCIQLRNNTFDPWDNIKEVRLFAETAIGAHNNAGAGRLDLTTGLFSGTGQDNELKFELPEPTSIAAAGLQEFWGWFIPSEDQNWPELRLKVMSDSGEEMARSANTKPSRASATGTGKAFYFLASYEEGILAFDSSEIVQDIDGNIYTTVKIGEQTWMVENLKVTRYRNGDPVERVTVATEWDGVIGKYGVYQNNDMVANVAGNLYNWYALTDPRNIAPEGWRVPTEEDWTRLVNYLGGDAVAGGKLKSIDPLHWSDPNAGATNSSGFTAVGGGVAHAGTLGANLTVQGIYWCTTQLNSTTGLIRILEHNHTQAIYSGAGKRLPFSVRLIKTDEEEKDHTIELSASPSNAGTVTGAATYKKENWITISASPETGFTFDYWQVAGSGEVFSREATHSFQVTRDLSLVAVFKNVESVEDIDGNVYTTVEIGSQTWMVENLKVTRYRNGDPIERVNDDKEWGDVTGKYGVYQNNNEVVPTAGNLYNWYALTDPRDIAPEGWRVPTGEDWTILVNYLGGEAVAGGKLKSTDPSHWNSPNTGATNSSGFTAVGGGAAHVNVIGANFGIQGIYWSSSDVNATTGLIRIMEHIHAQAIYSGANKNNGYSVRLIKAENEGDEEPGEKVNTKIIAHRGYWSAPTYPQNSLSSLQRAIDLGIYGSELDVWITQDGVVVLNHDATINGITIEHSTSSQLSEVRLSNGEPLPTLQQCINLAKSGNTKLIIEIKPHSSHLNENRAVAAVLDLVNNNGMANKVDYISFSQNICEEIIKADPQNRVAYLSGNRQPDFLKERGYWGLDYNMEILKTNTNWLQSAKDLGLTTNVWTVNSNSDFEYFISMGVDFITTDYPQNLKSLLDSRK